jgi:hypothetical protein
MESNLVDCLVLFNKGKKEQAVLKSVSEHTRVRERLTGIRPHDPTPTFHFVNRIILTKFDHMQYAA